MSVRELTRGDEIYLPPGPYTVAVVDPRAVASGHITEERIVQLRKGWDAAMIVRSFDWIESENRTHDVLLRPQGNDTTILGFRGLDLDQLETLREHGFEPAMVVRAGEHFDVLLQAHTVFQNDELEAARRILHDTYDLPLARGVLRDAIHLPGSQVHPEQGLPSVVELLPADGLTFAASERLLEQTRQRIEQQHLDRRAEQLELPALPDHAPGVVVAEVLRDSVKVGYPEDQPLAALQRAIDERRSDLPAERPHRGLSDAELAARIENAQLPVHGVAMLGRDPLQIMPEESARLVALEGELAHRRREAELPLRRAETRLEAASLELDRRLESGALPEKVLAASRAYVEAVEKHRAAERAFLERVLAQVEGDKARLLVPMARPDYAEGAVGGYYQALERSLDLSARLGRELSVLDAGDARTEPERLEAHLLTSVEAGRDTARFRTSAESELVMRQEAATPLDLLRELHARDVFVGAMEGALRTAPTTADTRLVAAAERVHRGDLSPDTLRQAASATLRVEPGAALSTPRELPRSTEALAERYQSLSEGLKKSAETIQVQGVHTDREALTRFFSQATEMVRLHQATQELERRFLGLTDPPRPGESGFHTKAVAWLERALEKGLDEHQAVAHLANRTPQPFQAAGKAALEPALSAATYTTIALQTSRNVMRPGREP